MNRQKPSVTLFAKTLTSRFVYTIFGGLAAITISLTPVAFGQGTSVVPLPPAEPRIDQLGQMQGLPAEERYQLFVWLFIQTAVCVAVAVALAAHWSMPAKKKPGS